jgi:hypothetical protein
MVVTRDENAGERAPVTSHVVTYALHSSSDAAGAEIRHQTSEHRTKRGAQSRDTNLQITRNE